MAAESNEETTSKKKPREGQVVCKPRGFYAAVDLPESTEQWQRIKVGMEDCMRANPKPMQVEPNLTGRYADKFEDQVDVRSGAFPLVVGINHVEDHVELWISRTLCEPFKSTKRDVLRLSGDLEGSTQAGRPRFRLYSAGRGGKTAGYLEVSTVDDHIGLLLNECGWGERILFRYDNRATPSLESADELGPPWSMNAGASDEAKAVLRGWTYKPLSPRQLGTLYEACAGQKFWSLLHWSIRHSKDRGDEAKLYSSCENLDEYVGQMVPDVLGHPEDETAMHFLAQFILDNTPGTFEGRKESLRYWLDTVMNRQRESVVLPQLGFGNIRRYLGVEPSDIAGVEYVYEFQLSALEMNYRVVSGAVAEVLIEQVEPVSTPVGTFPLVVGGFGGSLSFVDLLKKLPKKDSVDSKGSLVIGTAKSQVAWGAQDFLGPFTQFELGVTAKSTLGLNVGSLVWTIHGSKHHPPLQVSFGTGLELSKGTDVTINASIQWGWIFDGNPQEADEVRMKYLEDHGTELVHKTTLLGTYFPSGSSRIGPAALQKLRNLVTRDLACFVNPDTRVTIYGMADSVDGPRFNQVLSQMRAENVLRHLTSMLGNNFRVPESNHRVVGWGEEVARLRFGDNRDAPDFRVAVLMVNGRFVLSMPSVEP